MKQIVIRGGSSLYGQLEIQGSKNAALPILAASVLVPGTTFLRNCPEISDVKLMMQLLECLGMKIQTKNSQIEIDGSNVNQKDFPSECVSGMRSSILLAGAVLARLGEVNIGVPGGCKIGARPIDLHLMAFEKLGANIEKRDTYYRVCAKRLKGAKIIFPISSVGATENAIMAAMGAQGTTVIGNAACEPEVQSLCRFLQACGGDISGVGTKTLIIREAPLHSVSFPIPSDRIVAGTYLLTMAGCGGKARFYGIPMEELTLLIHILRRLGADIKIQDKCMEIAFEEGIRRIPYLETGSYPGFPTDLQPQLATVLCRAGGVSMIRELIFENRFGFVKELRKMGADIREDKNLLTINPIKNLQGALVEAPDLRGGAALVIGGLMASGTTVIENVSYIERGYVDMVQDLQKLGADIFYKM